MDNSDRTQPTSSSIVITGDPRDYATYGAGDFIEVRVTLSDDVNIIGVPQLELDFDGEGKTDHYVGTWQGASQETHRANSHMNLRFGYTVAEADLYNEGIAIGADKPTLNEGTINEGTIKDGEVWLQWVEVQGHRPGPR